MRFYKPKYRIMKTVIKDLAVTFVGFVAFLPCMFLFSGDLLSEAIGLVYGFIFFRLLNTQRGKKCIRAYWRSSYRLEQAMFGGHADC